MNVKTIGILMVTILVACENHDSNNTESEKLNSLFDQFDSIPNGSATKEGYEVIRKQESEIVEQIKPHATNEDYEKWYLSFLQSPVPFTGGNRVDAVKLEILLLKLLEDHECGKIAKLISVSPPNWIDGQEVEYHMALAEMDFDYLFEEYFNASSADIKRNLYASLFRLFSKELKSPYSLKNNMQYDDKKVEQLRKRFASGRNTLTINPKYNPNKVSAPATDHMLFNENLESILILGEE